MNPTETNSNILFDLLYSFNKQFLCYRFNEQFQILWKKNIVENEYLVINYDTVYQKINELLDKIKTYL